MRLYIVSNKGMHHLVHVVLKLLSIMQLADQLRDVQAKQPHAEQQYSDLQCVHVSSKDH